MDAKIVTKTLVEDAVIYSQIKSIKLLMEMTEAFNFQGKKKEANPEQVGKMYQAACDLTLRWENITSEGKPLQCNDDNKMLFYTANPQVAMQVIQDVTQSGATKEKVKNA